MGQWYLIARHPEGEWEKESGPYPSQAEALMRKDAMIQMYESVSKNTFCPLFSIYAVQNTDGGTHFVNDGTTTWFHGGSVH